MTSIKSDLSCQKTKAEFSREMNISSEQKSFGFTLIELIIVIMLIGLLIALLLPAISAARSSAARMSCAKKMSNLGIAIHSYSDIHNQLPPSKWGTETDILPRHNVLTFLLPYLELENVYNLFNFSVHWSNHANDNATKRDLSIFQCPQAPRMNRHGSSIYYVSDYAVAERIQKTTGHILPLFTNGTVTQRNGTQLTGMLRIDGESLHFEAVSDGLSNTMMFFECSSRPFIYGVSELLNSSDSIPNRSSSGADWSSNKSAFYIEEVCGADKMQLINCTNREEIYSFHAGGSNFLFGDGSIHFIQSSIHPEQFISLFTPIGGDIATIP
jgi:prepilin-type N-terminal cleavage/methylation domain-containing protein/prepilin-type processing-associated H-X9-DG protein